MSGRHVIVTGASPGSIGHETARILANWGASVVATSKSHVAATKRSLKEAMNDTGVDESAVTVRPLDLREAASVRDFVSWYRKHKGETLHVLINNAAILQSVLTPWTRLPRTEDGFDVHWRVNYLGAFHLTSLLLPLLKRGGQRSGDARVVNVTSHLHDQGKNEDLLDDEKAYYPLIGYGRSKLALIHFSREIERRFAREHNLHSTAAHPGSVNTNMTRVKVPEGRIGTVWNRVVSALAPRLLLHPTHGAQTIVMCASDSPLRGGGYYARCRVEEPSDECADEDVARRLWGRSEAWVRTLEEFDGGET